MAVRRATVAAEEDDLAVLAQDARHRGMSLARVFGESVAEKAAEIRQGRQRRVATFRVDASIANDLELNQDAPASDAFR